MPLKDADKPLATVASKPWDGIVTLKWDPNDKLYFCESFEAIFTKMHISYWDDAGYKTQEKENFEVNSPASPPPSVRTGSAS